MSENLKIRAESYWRAVNIGKFHLMECMNCRITRDDVRATNGMFGYKYCPECGAKMMNAEGNKNE